MIRHACLNVSDAYTWGRWWRFIDRTGPVDWMADFLRDKIRAEYRRLTSQYAEAAE